MQWAYRFDNYALLTNWILLFSLVLTLQTILPYVEFVLMAYLEYNSM